MSADERPLDGGNEQIKRTGNGPMEDGEEAILRDVFGAPDPDGVYAPYYCNCDCNGECA